MTQTQVTEKIQMWLKSVVTLMQDEGYQRPKAQIQIRDDTQDLVILLSFATFDDPKREYHCEWANSFDELKKQTREWIVENSPNQLDKKEREKEKAHATYLATELVNYCKVFKFDPTQLISNLINSQYDPK